MSTFCDFVPDDASCAKPEPEGSPDMPEGGGMDGDKMENEGEMMEMEMNPMLGNLTYLHVALFGLIEVSLEMFRYHDDAEYDAGEVLGTNLWKYASMTHHYSELAFMGVLTITQLLSMFGIAGEINIMAWMYIEMAVMVLELILKLVNLYIIDASYNIMMDTTDTGDNRTNATAVNDGVKEGAFSSMVAATSVGLALYTQHENWMYAQVMALPEEAQAKYMHGEKHEEHHDENMENMQEMFGLFLI